MSNSPFGHLGTIEREREAKKIPPWPECENYVNFLLQNFIRFLTSDASPKALDGATRKSIGSFEPKPLELVFESLFYASFN